MQKKDVVIKILPAKTFEPPEYMTVDARMLWLELGPQLLEMGILSPLDFSQFEMLCTSYAIARQAAETLQREGLIVPGGRDGDKKSPALQAFQSSVEAFRKLAATFGLSPLSRTKLGIFLDEPELVNPWASKRKSRA